MRLLVGAMDVSSEVAVCFGEVSLRPPLLVSHVRPRKEEITVPPCNAPHVTFANSGLALREGGATDARHTPHGSFRYVISLRPPCYVSCQVEAARPLLPISPTPEEAPRLSVGFILVPRCPAPRADIVRPRQEEVGEASTHSLLVRPLA